MGSYGLGDFHVSFFVFFFVFDNFQLSSASTDPSMLNTEIHHFSGKTGKTLYMFLQMNNTELKEVQSLKASLW